MATIVPFRGIRFNREKAGDLAELVTPPYDVIDDDSQEAFYQVSPYNIIRLEYGKKYATDSESDNRYTRAAAYYQKWRCEGVLVKDNDPSLYLYQQEFKINDVNMVRTGFTCGVKLEPYEKEIILPHEETMPKHKADRLELMRACRANFSPIFGLFSDPERKVDKFLLDVTTRRKPDVEFKDWDGQIHRMWVLSEEETISRVQEAMEKQRIFIADGHHRYETALAYRDERRKAEPASRGERPYDYVMMTLVNLYDPGLAILPTHRLVKHVEDVDRFLSQVKKEFSVEEVDSEQYYHRPEKVYRLLRDRAGLGGESQGGHGHVFAVYPGERRLFLLTLKDESILETSMPANHSRAWNQLDVSVLQNLVLEKYLGIGPDERASGDYLKYTRDGHEVFDEVDNGNYRMGILMNPTIMEEVIKVASGGEKMPQKSTYFYPKLITGLVINEL